MAALDPVLQPYQLKNLRLKNRVMSTAHAPSYVEDGKPKLRYRSITRRRPRAAWR